MIDKLTEKLAALAPEKREKLLQMLRKKKLEEQAAATQTLAAPRKRERSGMEPIPLTSVQQRLWFLQQLEPDNPFYNIPSGFKVSGLLNEQLLIQSLERLAERHEVLRTTFDTDESGNAVQIIADKPDIAWRSADLRHLAPAEREAESDRIMLEDVMRPCDLTQGPLWRTTIIRTGEAEYRLIFTMHHIVFDGWSLSVFIRELAAIYEALSVGAPLLLPPPPMQYADYALERQERLSKGLLKEQLAYWEEHLAGALPILELPADRPRPPVQTFRGAMHTLILPVELYTELKSISREEGVTLFMTLLALFKILLYRYSGLTDIIVGFPISGRHEQHLENMIGVFVNTLPLRSNLSGDPTFSELLAQVRQTALHAYENQDVPFDMLVETLKPERNLSHNPLFQVLFTYQNALPPIEAQDIAFTYEAVDGGTAKFDLSLDIFEGPEGPTCIFEYNTDLFDHERIVRMAGHFQTLAEAAVQNRHARISTMPLLTEEERRMVLTDWNDRTLAYDQQQTVHERFEQQAARTPEQQAVTLGERSWTYAELNERANRIARTIQKMGAAPGTLVGICAERSLDMMACVLAVVKAGAAYVPIDPSYPEERIAYMLEDSQATVILTQGHLKHLFVQEESAESGKGAGAAAQRKVLCVDTDWERIASEPADNLPATATGDDLAYVIYTSGTTGKPKGTMVRHSSLVNAYLGWEEAYGLRTEVRTHLQLASFSFDVFTGDWVRALLSGGRLVLIERETLFNAKQMYEVMVREHVEFAEFVPAVLRNLIQYLEETNQKLDFMRVLCVGSDRWYGHEYKYFQKFLGDHTRLINSYGLTEATIDSTYYDGDVSRLSDEQLVPIGRPFANQQLYVLDEHMQPVPVGITGELYIAGAGLAAGYWRRPDLTAERFLPHPFCDEPGARIYRTGDLARYLPDGNVELYGRADHQVKLRGFRIELGEIETAMLRMPEVRECAAYVWNETQLAACIVPKADMTVQPDQVRKRLQDVLPDYMVPSYVTVLDKLPLTSNGKVDRSALPEPNVDGAADGSYTAPRTLIEEMLAGIWADAFGLRRVSIHAEFFELGGHSLLAIQIMTQIRKVFQVELTLQTLFQAPTVAKLAAVIAEKSDRSAEYEAAVSALPELRVQPEARYEKFPLTDVQQAYLIGRNDAFEMGNVSTHSYDELEVDHIDPAKFQTAWNLLIARHDMLRAVVTEDGMQQVLEHVPVYHVPVLDLRCKSDEEVEQALLAVRGQMSHQMLDTSRWPVFDLRLTLLDGGRARIHLSSDALIFDAWSYVILLKELSQLHQDPSAQLPELGLTFRDYVLTEASLKETEAYKRSWAYWKERVPHLPPAPELPMAKSPSALQNPTFSRLHDSLPADQWTRLKSKATRMGLTASGVLLAAYAEVLAAWSKNPDFCLNLTFLNRLQIHPQVHDVVGEFTSLTLLEVNRSGREQASFIERARQTQQTLWNDLEHNHVSGVQVLRELARVQGGSTRALMPVVFTSALTLPIPDRDTTGFDLKPLYSITQTSQVWLDCGVWEDEKVMYCNWDVVRELFPEGMLEDMFAAYFELLRRLADEDDIWHEANVIRLRQVMNPLGEALVEASEDGRSEVELEPNVLMHSLFERQAAADPRRIAIVDTRCKLTYGELDRLTTKLAHHLRTLGAKPNDLVAVVMEKGWEQAAGTLAVLKSGAAYLPIDPEWPQERIDYLLDFAEVDICLTQSWITANVLGKSGHVHRIDVDLFDAEFGEKERGASVESEGAARYAESEEPSESVQSARFAGSNDTAEWQPLQAVQQPDDLAYVIFTSGSTGLPKGVMIDHRGAVNTLLDMNERFRVTERDKVLALSALSFDLSVYDIFGTLAAGGTIVFPEAADRKDPAHWMELLQRERVTIWNSVPALMSMLVEYCMSEGERLPDDLRLVLMSGDWIPIKLPDQIRGLKPDVELVSLGGATEASIWSILYPIGEVNPQWTSIPYGKPMKRQGVHVLNAALEPCPVWVPGQLYISGVGLAKGYFRDEDKTNASFIRHPRTGERLYRTGDLGRYLPDGNIEFLGREDFQVKVQGYRIELGEIESAIVQHAHVRDAVAVVASGPDGKQRIAAYVVLQDDGVEPEELRQYLLGKIPSYMVPSAIRVMDALPLTANGKVDRKGLPPIEWDEAGSRDVRGDRGDEPETTTEKLLVTLWQELIPAQRIGVHDNFFELGGDSLQAVRFMMRLKQTTGIQHPLRILFERPTIAELATYLDNEQEPVERQAGA